MIQSNILIILPNWIGDVVMSLPTIETIREFFPRKEIYILIKETIYPLIEENCNNLGIKPVFYSQKDFKETIDIIKKLRKYNFEKCFILPRSYRMFLITLFSGIKEKYGYGDFIKNLFYVKSLKRDKKSLSKHRVYYYLDVAKLYKDVDNFKPPLIKINKSHTEWAKDFLKDKGINKEFLIGLNPGATYGLAKCWGKEKFKSLIKSLLKKNPKFNFFIFGGKDNVEYNSYFNNTKNSYNLTGKLSLIETASLINECKIFVTNDTGPMHIADALKKDIIAIFGPTDPNETPPFQMNKFIVYEDLECSPCKERECPLKHNKCMKNISVEKVENIICKILDYKF